LVKGVGTTNYFGSRATNNYSTLAAWQTGTTKDANSYSEDPLYSDTLNGNYKPQLASIDNKGTATANILTDITNASRSLFTPDLGAYEFAPNPCSQPPVAGIASVTPNSGMCLETPIQLTLTGTSPLGSLKFQWQTSTTGGAPWTNIGPLTYSPTFDTVSTISRYYRCLVYCGNGTPTVSSTTFITLNPLLPAGTYTVDATLPQSTPPYLPGANFQTFQSAVTAALCGVTGHVIFNVKGTYTEQINIPYVPGTNANATVTFQSYNGLPSGGQLTYASTVAASNYTLKLDSVRYFNFRNLTLAATNTTNGRVIEFANGSNNDSLARCVINAPVVTTSTNTVSAVYANGLRSSNIFIKGNTINNGSYGISFSGTSAAVLSPDHLIDSNFVNNAYAYGIYTNFTQRIKLSRNTVNFTGAAATNAYGVYATDADSSYKITNNTVNISNSTGTSTIYGLYINNCDGSGLNRGKVTGNDVVATTSNAATLYGLYVINSPFIDVLNNTVAIGTSAASSYGLYNSNSSNGNYYNNSINSIATSATNNYAAYFGNTTATLNNIKNNIFSHKAGGKALYINTTANVISNYNMLYTSGTNLVERGTPAANYSSLAAWITATFQDQFSMVYNPAFVSSSNLKPDLTNPDVWAIHGRGLQILDNTYDHDNASRPTTLVTGVPDLGAYEFFPTALPTVLLATPATPAANTEQVFSYGTDTVMRLKWGAVAPPSIQVRRYSGVVPTGLAAANLDSMYFYTKVDVPGNGNYDYDAKLYYLDPWLGSIGGLTSGVYQLGLGKTTASFGNPWVVGFTSRNDVPKRMIYQTALAGANLDRFTGLLNPYAPPILPDQDSSNVGKRFWVAYPLNQLAGGQDMVLYFSTQSQPANVQVKIGGTGGYVRNYVIPANTVFSTGSVPDLMPKAGAQSAYLATAGVFDQGISIVSDVPIVAYAHTYGSASSGATMLMPVGTWGYQYKTLCITSSANFSDSRPFFFVIADNDNTVVNVTPSGPVANTGMSTNNTSTVTLNKGQVLLVLGTSASEDLTGSVVKSVSNSAGKCYPVAVFSGNSRLSLNVSGVNSGGDFTIQQNFPSTAWGKRYLTAPTSTSNNANTFSTNVYRVAVKDPTTVVTRNGVPLSPLYNNHYYEYTSNTADFIEADKPVMVAQFTGDGTVLGNSGSVGDPEMMYISPIEQRIKNVGFYRNTLQAITANLFTMIIPTNGLASLQMVDGATPFTADLVYPHPQNGSPSLKGVNYSVVVKRWTSAQQQVRIQSDSAFTGITYGLGSVESYGYNMGTLIKNLGVVGDTLINGVTGNLYNCVGTPFKFKVKTPVIPTSMTWKFSQVPFLTPNADVTVANPVPSGTVVINGETYYQFTLNNFYTFSQPGLYQVPVVITHPDIESCDNTLTSIVYVQVIPSPAIGFTVTFAGCQDNTAQFVADNATSGGIGVNTWNWVLTNGVTTTTPTGSSVSMVYPNAGTFTDSLHVVTSDGCIRDTARTIVVNPKPVVTVATDSLAICTGGNASFTASSQIATGVVYKWYTVPTGGTSIFTGATYALTNVTASTVYYVEGTSSFGCISNLRKRVVINVLTPLTPVVVSVTGSTATTVSFSWNAIPGATYQVSTTGPTGPWSTPSSGASGLTHTVTGLGILTNTTLTVQAIGLIACQTSTSLPVSGCTNSPAVITPDSVAICIGTSYTYLVNAPLPPNVVYTWYTVPTTGTALTSGTAYTINATGSSFTVNSLSPAGVYYYYAGQNNPVTGCVATTRKKVAINALAPLVKPVVPIPTFTSITPISITFNWSAVPGAVGGYEVSINNGVSWTTPSTGSNGLSHTVAGLSPSTTVTILVRALGYLPCQTSVSDPTTAKTYTDAVYVPNAFNPGSNMTSIYGADNRVLRIYGYVIQTMQFMVFNQWGEKVFESTNQNSGWDGSYKGKAQPSGVYIYVLRFTTTTGETKEIKGSVSLIR
jgi:gliding motility-associated-like protein